MKKTILLCAAVLGLGASAYSQAVRDRAAIPVAVNLNQVLRLSVTDGGNIEFTFNTIDDYRDGISGDAATSTSANAAGSDPQYQTSFTVASSTDWDLNYGAENATFIGTDNVGNTLALDNVGYSIVANGTNNFAGGQVTSTPTNDGAEVAALQVYPVALLESGGTGNAGDVTENDFTLIWRAGTVEGTGLTTPMNAASLLAQGNIVPDRYTVNVLFELAVN